MINIPNTDSPRERNEQKQSMPNEKTPEEKKEHDDGIRHDMPPVVAHEDEENRSPVLNENDRKVKNMDEVNDSSSEKKQESKTSEEKKYPSKS